MDWAIGKAVRALKKSGMYDNTIIVFTSDVSEKTLRLQHQNFTLGTFVKPCSCNGKFYCCNLVLPYKFLEFENWTSKFSLTISPLGRTCVHFPESPLNFKCHT